MAKVGFIGTGGTICGVGKYLKEKKPSIKIVAVDPKAPQEKTCLLGCGVTTGYGAATNTGILRVVLAW